MSRRSGKPAVGCVGHVLAARGNRKSFKIESRTKAKLLRKAASRTFIKQRKCFSSHERHNNITHKRFHSLFLWVGFTPSPDFELCYSSFKNSSLL